MVYQKGKIKFSSSNGKLWLRNEQIFNITYCYLFAKDYLCKKKQTDIRTMKIKLLFIFACLLMACQKEDNVTQPIDSSTLGIDHITINNKDYAIANSFMIDKSAPLVCIGSSSSNNTKVELDYMWSSLTADLSAVSLTSSKAQVEVSWEEYPNYKTCTLKVYTTNPKAEVKYVISALKK